jgi:hypothetical protein
MATRHPLFAVMIAVGVLGAAGCATVGLTILGAAAGTAAGTGTAYTLDGFASRTFTAPLEQLRQATLAAFGRMEIPVASDDGTEARRRIRARAGNRAIVLHLHRLTANLTRLQVTATHHWLLRDRATAGEIVAQVEQALHAAPALSGAAR